MFSDGVNSVKELANQRKSRANELAGNLASRRVSITMTVHVLLVKVWEASASYAGLEEASLEFSWKDCIMFRFINLLITLNKKTFAKDSLDVAFNQ